MDNGDLVRALEEQGASQAVLAAVRAVDRGGFVPEELRAQACFDEPVPIPHGQVTTQPSLIARMIGALALGRDDKVLEIGTGYGYQTALLARLCARVCSIERFEDLSRAAAANLERAGCRNVALAVGDGTLGWPEQAPFDAVVSSAAAPAVPPPLAAQLREGGRLVQPVGPGGAERVVLYEKRGGELVERAMLTRASFVRMAGRHGCGG